MGSSRAALNAGKRPAKTPTAALKATAMIIAGQGDDLGVVNQGADMHDSVLQAAAGKPDLSQYSVLFLLDPLLGQRISAML